MPAGCAVVMLEIGVDLRVGAGRVVVDRQRQVHGTGEPLRIASGRARRRPHFAHCGGYSATLGELGTSRRRAGRAHASSGARRPRPRSADRRADAASGRARRLRPSSVLSQLGLTLPVHSARQSARPSIIRPTRLSNGTPVASNSARCRACRRRCRRPGSDGPRRCGRASPPDARADGIAQSRQQHGGAELDLARARRHRGQQGQRIVARPGQQRSPTQTESNPSASARSASASSEAVSCCPP